MIAGSLFIGSRPVGLLLRSEWYLHFVCSIDDPRHIAVRLRAGPARDLLCASAHLPGPRSSTIEFEGTLDSLGRIWDECPFGAIGIDANAQLGIRKPTDCPWVVGVLDYQVGTIEERLSFVG